MILAWYLVAQFVEFVLLEMLLAVHVQSVELAYYLVVLLLGTGFVDNRVFVIIRLV